MRTSSIALCGLLLSWAGSALAADPPPVPVAPAAAAEPETAAPTPPVAAAAAPAATATATPGPTATTAEGDAEGKFAAAPEPIVDTFAAEEGSGDSDTQRKLDLYGFADFTYQRLLIDKDNVWNKTYPSVNSFAVGNFNVYLSSNLGDSW